MLKILLIWNGLFNSRLKQIVSRDENKTLNVPLGRRILLFASASLMIFASYWLGVYFWFLKYDTIYALKIHFLPLSSLCLFIIAFSIGYGPIPLLIMSELFPPEAKGAASSIISKSNAYYFWCNFHFTFDGNLCSLLSISVSPTNLIQFI